MTLADEKVLEVLVKSGALDSFGNEPGELRRVNDHAQLGVDERRARVPVEGAEEQDFPVDQEALGM